MYPESLKDLIESFKYLPGIGEKTAERLAFATMDLATEKIELFTESLKNVKSKIHACPKCNNITEENLCLVCQDKTRDQNTLCIVEDSKSVFLFEKIGTYHGLYHVIQGLISPLNGINPEDIGLDTLINRLKEKDIHEVIIAVKPNIEGETTALYIKKMLSSLPIKVTRLASGIPIGADMEYIDVMTLERALTDRKEIA